MIVLLVHSGAGMTTGDNNLRTFIEGQGYSVFTRAATASEDLIGARAVVVSESCASADVNTKYGFLPVPVLTLEAAVTDDWNMAASSGSGGDAMTIVTEDPRFTGSLTVAGSPYDMGTGVVSVAVSPCSGAVVLADETGSGEASYFYVSRGGALTSGVAAGLRIFLGINDDLLQNGLSSDGQQLLFGALRELYKATLQPRGRVFMPTGLPPNTPGYIRSNGGVLLAANAGRILRAA